MPDTAASWAWALVGAGIGAVGALVSAALGYALNEWSQKRRERRAQLGRLHAVRVETEHCGELLRTFQRDMVMAPLYRLPTWAGEQALGVIVVDGALGDAAIQTLPRYYTAVTEFNRGLDRAGLAAAVGNNALLQDEFGRLHSLKAPAILDSQKAGELSLQERVERAIKGAIDAI
jgi:hypothetical protein